MSHHLSPNYCSTSIAQLIEFCVTVKIHALPVFGRFLSRKDNRNVVKWKCGGQGFGTIKWVLIFRVLIGWLSAFIL